MAAMTMSSSLVSQRIVTKAASARRARNVQVRARARSRGPGTFPERVMRGSASPRAPTPRARPPRLGSTVADLDLRANSAHPSFPHPSQVRAAAKGKKPKVISKAAELRLIGKAVTAAEELGLLGIADSISLSDIEKAGLLSKGEALIYDRSAPGTIAALGFVLAAVGLRRRVPVDDSAGLVARSGWSSPAPPPWVSGVALTGSNLLRKLQN